LLNGTGIGEGGRVSSALLEKLDELLADLIRSYVGKSCLVEAEAVRLNVQRCVRVEITSLLGETFEMLGIVAVASNFLSECSDHLLLDKR